MKKQNNFRAMVNAWLMVATEPHAVLQQSIVRIEGRIVLTLSNELCAALGACDMTDFKLRYFEDCKRRGNVFEFTPPSELNEVALSNYNVY